MSNEGTWIIDQKSDLKWFVFPFLLTPIFLGSYFGLQAAGMSTQNVIYLLFIIFMGLFDQPHFARTFARTHADKIEFERHKTFHKYFLPASCLLALALLSWHWTKYFFLFTAILGQWHIFRQNYGLNRAYPHGGIPKGRVEFVFFHLMYLNSLSPYFLRSDVNILSAWAKNFHMQLIYWKWIVLIGFLISGGFYLKSILQNWNQTQKKPWPWIIFLTGVLFTHVLNYNLAAWVPIPLMVVLETAYHDIQYQGWMNFYQRQGLQQTSGTINKWIIFSFAYGIFAVVLAETTDRVALLVNMVVLYHYLADGIIWKFSSQAELRPLFK